ncbi:uncharacterized protein LOC131322834 [Rhododendron vialii]|uniref:uncharacterized protein LOC131322834 n=1 Tax=Rhododendron vialii TaxID=182163 RepID=UPI00265ED23D|nr:uncharacterized protein LOC131322834 [Rhododendron vialii]
MGDLIFDDQDVVSRLTSDAPPTHYTVKIQLFSLLTANNIERYDSGDFEAGGYKWKLAICPNGNKSKNIKDHLSVYLVMSEANLLKPGWEVHAVFRLFLLDQNKDNYLILQDTSGKRNRFHGMKMECGFDQFIPLKTFTNIGNGYLVNDTCIFGAEVFISKEGTTGKGESLSMVKDAITYKQQCKIENFSKLNVECYDSKEFNAGDHKWKIQVYPKGKGSGAGTHISLYLALADTSTLPPNSKIYVELKLRIVDQINAKDYSGKATYWFSASRKECGGSRFTTLTHFNQPGMGLLVKDTCLVEAELTIHGVASPV